MILIDYKDTRPIYEQVVSKFQTLILKGVLETNEKMPSVRGLAIELSINPNTIQKAYAELERQGFIYTVKGRGNYVSVKDQLIEIKKEEILLQFVVLMKEAKDIGLSQEVIIQRIRREN